MLSKKICKQCYRERRVRWRKKGDYDAERLWRDTAQVKCIALIVEYEKATYPVFLRLRQSPYVSMEYTHKKLFLRTYQNAPKECYFYLEQMMEGSIAEQRSS